MSKLSLGSEKEAKALYQHPNNVNIRVKITHIPVATTAETMELMPISLSTRITQRCGRPAILMYSMDHRKPLEWFGEDASWQHDRAWWYYRAPGSVSHKWRALRMEWRHSLGKPSAQPVDVEIDSQRLRFTF